MSYVRNGTKFVAAVVGMLAMAIIASRQFYLFVALRNEQGLLDSQGGRYHLWLAAGAGLLASIAACLMFLFFLGREKSVGSEVAPSPLEPRTALLNVKPEADLPARAQFNAAR